MESCPTQAVLPLVGLAVEKVIRDRYKAGLPLSNTPRYNPNPSSMATRIWAFGS
ncbi:MAG: hypothetical protein R6U98_00285 [Pirellulaceae bacterium]